MRLADLIAEPWVYPGLVERREQDIRVVLAEWPPHTRPETLWTLFAEPDDSWWVRRVHRRPGRARPGGYRDFYGADGVLADSTARVLVGELTGLQVPLAWEDNGGVDGVVRRLSFRTGLSSVDMTWWEQPPELLEVSNWFDSATGLFDAALPAYSASD